MEKLNITVLYVDNDIDRAEEFLNYFEEKIEAIIYAHNGKEALDKIISNNIDLIITYEKVPILNAYNLLSEIRKFDEFLNAIIITQNCDLKMLKQISKIDILNDYINYPFKNEDLFELIKHNIKKVNFQKDKKETLNLYKQYQNALDLSAIVSKTDTKGIITYVNYKFCQISGYSKEELLGKPHNIVRHPDMPKEVFEDMWRTIKAKMVFHGIIKNLKKDGSSYYVDTTVMPILDNLGNIIEYIAIRFDITELEESIIEAKKANRAKTIFLANMSHEIRTPLNGILGFIKLLKEEELTSKQKQYINIIDTSANTLLHTINEILDMSKIQSGKFDLEFIKFDLFETLNNVQNLFIARANEKNIEFVLDIDNDLPHTIISDEIKLKQVLSNLIGNAIKFTSENGKVKLSAKILDKNEEKVKVKFSVSDTGIGISKEAQNKIFEPFMQAENSTTRKFGGTGLGLAISKEIVKLLGGELKLESEVNKGTTFYFELEFDYSNEIIEKSDEVNFEKEYDGKVLVAEDNIINQQLIEALFDKRKIEIIIVENGKLAVQESEKEKFDIIFLDINMPVMDGIEACKLIKEKKPNIPLIALTANALPGDREKYLSIGFDGYLSKPINMKELDKILDNYLKIKTKIKEKEELTKIDEEKLEENTTKEISKQQMDEIEIEKNNEEVDELEKIKEEEILEVFEEENTQKDDNKNLFNKSKAIERLGIPQELYDKILSNYITKYNKEIEELEKFIFEKDFDNIRLQAHKIKGASSNLSIDGVASVAKEIEDAAEQKIETDYENLLEKLKKYGKELNEYNNNN